MPGGMGELLFNLKSPFKVQGASNILLETIKQGDDIKFGSHDSEMMTYGGHAQVVLNIGHQVSIQKVFVTNLLEDELDELNILQVDDTKHTAVILMLEFRGFKVKTLKLIIGLKGSAYSALQE
ncbi:hypothetical protein PILCRDRAFT_89124 [Piloderma croceum F 1598]|uniref:Uncharacterized protein n=1 Tax=Piloderma croceum (strain F 1598) TaxID=765440 RepID=A0A0C3BVH6_PILCF|nr:hypothetical protein PILCRDRAFT_89124 [Piloderma croceum F 1598]